MPKVLEGCRNEGTRYTIVDLTEKQAQLLKWLLGPIPEIDEGGEGCVHEMWAALNRALPSLAGGCSGTFTLSGTVERFIDSWEKHTAPKYRTPTIEDLLNGPIKCEFFSDGEWEDGVLVAIDVSGDALRFYIEGQMWRESVRVPAD